MIVLAQWWKRRSFSSMAGTGRFAFAGDVTVLLTSDPNVPGWTFNGCDQSTGRLCACPR